MNVGQIVKSLQKYKHSRSINNGSGSQVMYNVISELLLSWLGYYKTINYGRGEDDETEIIAFIPVQLH